MSRAASFSLDDVTPALLAAHDKPGPRYTSYPTALAFHEGFHAAHHRASLEQLPPQTPLALYVHLPFCARRCDFCGCNALVANQPKTFARYHRSLLAEARMVANALGPNKQRVLQLHFGGGTPTHLPHELLSDLLRELNDLFDIDPQGDISIEAAPETTDDDQLHRLRALGFNRLSLGIQDFDPHVLAASGRPARRTDVAQLVATARHLRFASINFDMVYGLPAQTPSTFAATLQRTISLQPDRIAMYGFAYVPWMKKNQRRIDAARLPTRDERFGFLAQAIVGLTRAGYHTVGMDHFALPTDDLYQAAQQGTLHRNFMGYTAHRTPVLVGLGLSAISSTASTNAQNHKSLSRYHAAIESGELPVERGIALESDDLVRRTVITDLMCHFAVSFADIEAQFDIDFARYFAPELRALDAARQQTDLPLTAQTPQRLEATPAGRLFIRNVCMHFDARLHKDRTDGPAYSRTV